MPQTEIEQTISAQDFDEMVLYFQQEPWGPFRDNIHSAQICALLANIYRTRGTPAYTHEDFMISTDRQARVQRRKAKVVEFFRFLARRKDADGNA